MIRILSSEVQRPPSTTAKRRCSPKHSVHKVLANSGTPCTGPAGNPLPPLYSAKRGPFRTSGLQSPIVARDDVARGARDVPLWWPCWRAHWASYQFRSCFGRAETRDIRTADARRHARGNWSTRELFMKRRREYWGIALDGRGHISCPRE